MTAMRTIGGRAWSFGDNVSTEYMMPGFTMLGKMTDDLAKHHCMAALRPEFAKDVKLGDVCNIIPGFAFKSIAIISCAVRVS